MEEPLSSNPEEARLQTLLEDELTIKPEAEGASPEAAAESRVDENHVVPPVIVPPVPPVAAVSEVIPPVPAIVEDDDEDGEGKPEDSHKPKQIRLAGKLMEVAKAAKALVAAGMTEEEAIRRVTAPIAEVPPVPKVEEAAPEPSAKEARLAEVRAKLKEIAVAGTVYDEDNDALQEERADLIADLKIEKAEAARKAQAINDAAAQKLIDEKNQTFDSAFDKSFTKVAELYGDEGKEGGKLGEAIGTRLMQILEDPKHRFHTVAQKGEYLPEDVMHDVAQELGLKPNFAATPAAPATPSVLKPAGLPLRGGDGANPADPKNPAQKAAHLKEALDKAATPDEMLKIMEAEDGEDSNQPTAFRFAA